MSASLRYVLIAAAVLLAVAVAVFVLRPGPGAAPEDPQMRRLRDLVGLAERTCLSNTSDSDAAGIKLTLEAVDKSVKADAAIEQKRDAARGAARALSEQVQQLENAEIRTCMQPWAEKIRDLATAAPGTPAS